MSTLCACGHPSERHGVVTGVLGTPGVCFAQIDTRHVSTGGSGLSPCPCKCFTPMSTVPFGNVPAGQVLP